MNVWKEVGSLQTWVLFIASGNANLLHQIAQGPYGRVRYYRIHDVVYVAGQGPHRLAQGWSVLRIESDAPIYLAEESQSADESPLITFRGVTQDLRYTSDPQRQELEARSRAEVEPSPETTAVLIPVAKSPKWWELAHDRRNAYFQASGAYPGHTAIGTRYVDRVFRKLYHSRNARPSASYDFLTYFEFHRAHTDDFRRLLIELRDTARNPEWAYVELEYEIWMTKIAPLSEERRRLYIGEII